MKRTTKKITLLSIMLLGISGAFAQEWIRGDASSMNQEDAEWARGASGMLSFEADDDGGLWSPEAGEKSRIQGSEMVPEAEGTQAEQSNQAQGAYGDDDMLRDLGADVTRNLSRGQNSGTSQHTAFGILNNSMYSEGGTSQIASHGCTIRRHDSSDMTYLPDRPEGQQIVGDGLNIDEETCQESYTDAFDAQCTIVGESTECIDIDNNKKIYAETKVYQKDILFDYDTAIVNTGYNVRLFHEYVFYTNSRGRAGINTFGSSFSSMRAYAGIVLPLRPFFNQADSIDITVRHGAELSGAFSSSPSTTFRGITPDNARERLPGGVTDRSGPMALTRNNGIGFESDLRAEGVSAAEINDVTHSTRMHAEEMSWYVYAGQASSSSRGRLRSRAGIYNITVYGLIENTGYNGNIDDLPECYDGTLIDINDYCTITKSITLTPQVAQREGLMALFENDTPNNVCWVAGTESVCTMDTHEPLEDIDQILTGAFDEQAFDRTFLEFFGQCETVATTRESESTLSFDEQRYCDAVVEPQFDDCDLERVIELDDDGNIIVDRWEGSDRCMQMVRNLPEYENECQFDVSYDEPACIEIDGEEICTCDEYERRSSIMDRSNFFTAGVSTNTAGVQETECPETHPNRAGSYPLSGNYETTDDRCVYEKPADSETETEFKSYSHQTNDGGGFSMQDYSVAVPQPNTSRLQSTFFDSGLVMHHPELGMNHQGAHNLAPFSGCIASNVSGGWRNSFWGGFSSTLNFDAICTTTSYSCPAGYTLEDRLFDAPPVCVSEPVDPIPVGPSCPLYDQLNNSKSYGNDLTQNISVSNLSCPVPNEPVCEGGNCYNPATDAEDTCQALDTSGCTLDFDRCAFDADHPLGSYCSERERSYSCEVSHTSTQVIEGEEMDCGDEGSFSCFDDSCFSIEDEVNPDFGKAAALINAAENIQSHMECDDPSDMQTCRIFGAEHMSCRRGRGQFRRLWDCCDTDSEPSTPAVEQYIKDVVESPEKLAGAGVAIIKIATDSFWSSAGSIMEFLVPCYAEEHELGLAKEVGSRSFIGQRCGATMSVGFTTVCTRKDNHYCKFESPLGRIMLEQTVGQAGRDMGTPRAPNCQGLTIEQIGEIDWSEVNLDEWEHIMRTNNALPPNTPDLMPGDQSTPMMNPGGGMESL